MAKPKDVTEAEQLRRLADGIDDIKKLLIFALIRGGASQGNIATALGVNQSSISRLFSQSKSRAK